MKPDRLVADPELNPLDLAIAPNGNIVVSSECPFGAADAVTSIREYFLAGNLAGNIAECTLFRPIYWLLTY